MRHRLLLRSPWEATERPFECEHFSHKGLEIRVPRGLSDLKTLLGALMSLQALGVPDTEVARVGETRVRDAVVSSLKDAVERAADGAARMGRLDLGAELSA